MAVTITTNIGYIEPMEPQEAAKLGIEALQSRMLSERLSDVTFDKYTRAVETLRLIAAADKIMMVD